MGGYVVFTRAAPYQGWPYYYSTEISVLCSTSKLIYLRVNQDKVPIRRRDHLCSAGI